MSNYLEDLEEDIRRKIINENIKNKPHKIVTELLEFGIRKSTLAKALDVGQSTIGRYAKGKLKMSEETISSLEALLEEAQNTYEIRKNNEQGPPMVAGVVK
jgi:ribosome-binding protein aMBF1 (putative translation factor)